MSAICLSIPRERDYHLPPITSSDLDSGGVYIGADPYPHLWPSGPHDRAPGAVRSVQAGFGSLYLDRGALRLHSSGRWEMLEFGPQWIWWHPFDYDHWLAACAFNRYGVGWSFGPAHNLHDEAYGKFEELCGIAPEPIQKWDIDYSLQLWRQLDSEWRLKFGQVLEPDTENPAQPTKPIEPSKPVDPTKPNPTPPKPTEEKPTVPTSNSGPTLTDIQNQLVGARLDISSVRATVIDGIDAILDRLATVHTTSSEAVLEERQWWHDKIKAIAIEWSTKRPQLSQELTRLLQERKVSK